MLVQLGVIPLWWDVVTRQKSGHSTSGRICTRIIAGIHCARKNPTGGMPIGQTNHTLQISVDVDHLAPFVLTTVGADAM
jgi:hypothetical protein